MAWAAKSEYDWAAAVHVTEAERSVPAHHPNTPNRHFSFVDDATIFRMLRSGESPSQVARAMGKTVTQITARVKNAQFKQRIRTMLANGGSPDAETGRVRPKTAFRRQLHPKRHDVVFRAPSSGFNGDLGDDVEEPVMRAMADDGFGATAAAFESDGAADAASGVPFTARQVASPMARSYAHFNRFHGRRR